MEAGNEPVHRSHSYLGTLVTRKTVTALTFTLTSVYQDIRVNAFENVQVFLDLRKKKKSAGELV